MPRRDHPRGEPRTRGTRTGRLARLGRILGRLRPSERSRWTRAGLGYLAVWLGLLLTGLSQQINLLLLTAGLAAGPLAASFVLSSSSLRKVQANRRIPPYVFEGSPLQIDYSLENGRRQMAALALELVDELVPLDRLVPGAARVVPRVLFQRVPAGQTGWLRWQGPSPVRGQYGFSRVDLITRSPFGLIERDAIRDLPGSVLVYPRLGRLSRRWRQIQRESTETRRGHRHDRSAQQQEYQGLREYRPGDSMRWIHWRTTARLGQPMVKEFEQQHDQELVLLLDPWLPRTKVTNEERANLETAIRFAATVCYDTCQQPGRRLLLGWTGATPGLRNGPASVKLVHEMLESLALMRGTPEGRLATLLDLLPPALVREALIVIIATRPVNLAEEIARSPRLAEASHRGLAGRLIVLDVSRGDLTGLFEEDGASAGIVAERHRLDGRGPGTDGTPIAPGSAPTAPEFSSIDDQGHLRLEPTGAEPS